MDRGTVLALTADRQRMVVAVDGDHCAAFELATPGEVEVGHRLRGNLESESCYALENLTTAAWLDVLPKGRYASLDEAKRAIGA